MDVKLVMFKSDGTRREFALSKPRTIIGRTNTADLRIPLSSVSRQHCEITVADGVVKVRDMGSSNGTHHNGTRIQEARLAPGDKILVGPVVFTVVIDGQPADVEQVRTVLETAQAAEVATEAPSAEPESPQKIEKHEEALPVEVEAETYTPTVDLDDPLAALQKLSEAAGDDAEPTLTAEVADEEDEAPTLGADDDIPLLADDEDDDIPLLADDEDDKTKQA